MDKKMSRNKVIATLIHDGRFEVAEKGGDIWLLKVINGRTVSIILESIDGGGRYTIRPPKYHFRSPSSHFDYLEEEERITRNKGMLFRLIRCLKDTKVWEVIDNTKGFFEINSHNPVLKGSKTLSAKVSAEFDSIRGF